MCAPCPRLETVGKFEPTDENRLLLVIPRTTKRTVVLCALGVCFEDVHKILLRFHENSRESVLVVAQKEITDRLASTQPSVEKTQLSELFPSNWEVRKEIIGWLRGWSDKKLFSGSDVKEFLRVADFSLWWLLDSWIADNGYFPHLATTLRWIWVVERLVRQFKPGRIVTVGADAEMRGIVRSVSQELGVAFENVEARGLKERLRDRAITRALLAFAKQMFFLGPVRLAALLGKKHLPKQTDLIIFSGDNPRSYFAADGRKKVADEYLGALIPHLEKRGVIPRFIGFHMIPKVKLFDIAKRSCKFSQIFCTFEAFMSLGTYLKAWRDAAKIARRWHLLRRKRALCQSFNFRGYDISMIMLPRLDIAFGHISRECLLYAYTCEVVIRKERPRAVLVAGETNYLGRSMVLSAKRHGRPVVAFQHGLINPNALNDVLREKDVQWEPVRASMCCPQPDAMITDNEHSRKQVIDTSKMASERVITHPGLRHFWPLYFMSNPTANIRDLNERAAGRLRVLLASQPLLVDAERQAMIRAVYNVARKHADTIYLVVKPHPQEDRPLFSGALRENLPENSSLLPAKSNIFEALAASDVLITAASTVVWHALDMRKKVMLVDTLKGDYINFFDASLIYAVAHSEAELDNVIMELTEKREQMVMSERQLIPTLEQEQASVFNTIERLALEGRIPSTSGMKVASQPES